MYSLIFVIFYLHFRAGSVSIFHIDFNFTIINDQRSVNIVAHFYMDCFGKDYNVKVCPIFQFDKFTISFLGILGVINSKNFMNFTNLLNSNDSIWNNIFDILDFCVSHFIPSQTFSVSNKFSGLLQARNKEILFYCMFIS